MLIAPPSSCERATLDREKDSFLRRVMENCAVCHVMSASVGQHLISPLPVCWTEEECWNLSSVAVIQFGSIADRNYRGWET